MKKLKKMFLADTWWYGLTRRLGERQFEKLARLRSEQGFTAVQLVVGIPPEVGPENPNASSSVGTAWNLKGEFNDRYLNLAREKIKYLNSLGLQVIVYGAWGQQIEWLGEKRMKDWWTEIVKTLDDLKVMYCITGESDIWIGQEGRLLPDKSTETPVMAPLFPPLFNFWKKKERRKKWSRVLLHVSGLTEKPVFIHVLPGQTSRETVNHSERLSAITVQTGHDPNSRKLLWQLPLEIAKKYPREPFINLEPWYEGIRDRFGAEDQLYAYWASMMAGACAYCYGAQGIWNAGDGKFLAHWGKQTMEQAMKLKTPRLLGISHRLFIESGFRNYREVEMEEKNGELVQITRIGTGGHFVHYIPDIASVNGLPKGKIFLPMQARFTGNIPKKGSVVVFSG